MYCRYPLLVLVVWALSSAPVAAAGMYDHRFGSRAYCQKTLERCYQRCAEQLGLRSGARADMVDRCTHDCYSVRTYCRQRFFDSLRMNESEYDPSACRRHRSGRYTCE